MKELTLDDALQHASRMCLFAKIYKALEFADHPLSAQENYLMAMAAVKQQTGDYVIGVPNPATHYAGVR
jgi:hypothetical protein